MIEVVGVVLFVLFLLFAYSVGRGGVTGDTRVARGLLGIIIALEWALIVSIVLLR